MNESDDSESEGYRLNLEPRGVTWQAFEHGDVVLQTLRELLWSEGLTWKIEEHEYSAHLTATTWICPNDVNCWLSFECQDGVVQLIQASLPEVDSRWSHQLATAVVRVIVIYQLVVEA